MHRDYYRTLGIHRDATLEEIHEAYRELARKYHPDLVPDDPEAVRVFKEIQEAFDVLSNLEQREVYSNTRQSDTSAEDAMWIMGKTHERSATSPPSSAGSSEYVTGMIVATIILVVLVMLVAFFAGVAPPSGEDAAQEDRESFADAVLGFLCCGGIPLLVIVIAVLAREHFQR